MSLNWADPKSPLHGWHVIAGSEHGTTRQAMLVGITKDPTGRWEAVLKLNVLNRKNPSAISGEEIPTDRDDGENADPTIFQGPNGNIHLLFTGRGGDTLKYYLIDPYKLTGEAPPIVAEEQHD